MFFCTHRGLQLKVTFGDSGSNIELALSIPYQIFLWKPINFKKNFWNWNFWIADRWNYCQVESFQLFSGKFEQHPLQKLGLNWIKIDFLIDFFQKNMRLYLSTFTPYSLFWLLNWIHMFCVLRHWPHSHYIWFVVKLFACQTRTEEI